MRNEVVLKMWNDYDRKILGAEMILHWNERCFAILKGKRPKKREMRVASGDHFGVENVPDPVDTNTTTSKRMTKIIFLH